MVPVLTADRDWVNFVRFADIIYDSFLSSKQDDPAIDLETLLTRFSAVAETLFALFIPRERRFLKT